MSQKELSNRDCIIILNPSQKKKFLVMRFFNSEPKERISSIDFLLSNKRKSFSSVKRREKGLPSAHFSKKERKLHERPNPSPKKEIFVIGLQ
jgi:hypothetical protein